TLHKTLEVMRCLTDVDHGIDLESVPDAFDRVALARAADGQNLRRSVDNLTSALEAVNATAAVAAPAAQAPTADPRTPTGPAADSSAAGHARPWADSRLVGFDLETTGVEPETARIVTAAFVDSATEVRTWLVDPGIEIPEAARAVHGITTEYAQANGAEARQGVTELCEIFSALKDAGAVVVGHNI